MTSIDHKFPKVNKEKCTGCGTCISVCPQNVFDLSGGKSVVKRPEDCVECTACVENCPVSAIKLVEPK
jgi:NAD-dependent dihydropyrimidine dehydrogenase PreA subunit